MNLNKDGANTDILKFSFAKRGIDNWNKLPERFSVLIVFVNFKSYPDRYSRAYGGDIFAKLNPCIFDDVVIFSNLQLIWLLLHFIRFQLAEMHSLADQNMTVSDKAQAELRNSRLRIEELNTELSRLTAQVC